MSSRSIGGAPDLTALARMHFHSLDREQQAAAIRRLAAADQGDHTIAHATGLSVEMVRRVLASDAFGNACSRMPHARPAGDRPSPPTEGAGNTASVAGGGVAGLSRRLTP